ncbi:MAG TPA: hypothetical protein VMB25_18925 [Bryobacteraceae bacterium]|nr:hypothetical protein [Bryobacteraceae bacterium]
MSNTSSDGEVILAAIDAAASGSYVEVDLPFKEYLVSPVLGRRVFRQLLRPKKTWHLIWGKRLR